ncbi:MAG: chromate transporter [Firmicutes bacterium]|nr:chromate transporter [Bacillota bacterium]
MGFVNLFAAFFRIGLFGFGGGLAMLPLIYQSVQQFGFMDAAEFSDLLALSQVTPGPIAVNAATYVGLHFAGLPGAAVATLGVVLPEFIIMLIVCRFLDRFRENRLVEGMFTGIRPVTIGLLLAAVLFVSDGVLVQGPVVSKALLSAGTEYYNFFAIGIAAVTVLLMAGAKMKPIRVMLLMAAAGAIAGGTGLIQV